MSVDHILEAFRARGSSAMFVTELAQALHLSPSLPALLTALEQLNENGSIVITSYASPDTHLADIDLRVIAPVPDETPRARAVATAAAQRYWSQFLAMFLASHRCQ
jgi:hypothetical protein